MKLLLLIILIICSSTLARQGKRSRNPQATEYDYDSNEYYDEATQQEKVDIRLLDLSAPVPPIRTIITEKPLTESEIKCPVGLINNGTACVAVNQCPDGYVYRHGRCTNRINNCPPGEAPNSSGKCVSEEASCSSGFAWNGRECIAVRINCPSGFRSDSSGQCLQILNREAPVCPDGFISERGNCVPDSGEMFLSRADIPPQPIDHVTRAPTLATTTPYWKRSSTSAPSPGDDQKNWCPLGWSWNGHECIVDRVPCSEGYYVDSFGQCVEISPSSTSSWTPPPPSTSSWTESPTLTSTIRSWIEIVTSNPNANISCPEGTSKYNNKCYRCRQNTKFSNGKCIRGSKTNVNVDVNFTGTSGNITGGAPSIKNIIEPRQNHIVNYNNVPIPIKLNNQNKNNIGMTGSFKCGEGSVRTVTVANKKVTKKCVKIEEKPENEPENCCEVMSPRKCHSQVGSQWSCSHQRRYSCGSHCIANRMFLEQTYLYQSNNFLMMPHNYYGGGYEGSCSWKACSGFDCSGCIGGSFNCASQCYTYPCHNSGCHFINRGDYCANFGGILCDN